MDLLGACLIGLLTCLLGYPILDSKGFHIKNLFILVIIIGLWNILYELL